MNPMRIGSIFSGIGGFEIALERTGVGGCVWYSEIDKYASAVYKYHYPEIKNYGDITTVNADELPDIDMLVGGFPCQSFSITGKRKGFDDTRGTLFFEFARILSHKRPRYFILENVKGLLSHDSGKTFQTILRILTETGYEYQWQILNTRWVLPQNRERIYIVGHLRGTGRPKIFPIRENCEGVPGENCKLRLEVQAEAKNRDSKLSDKELPQNVDNRHIYNRQMKIRRLTPTECLRLQGFPDDWCDYGLFDGDTVKKISDTQKYKMIGNAVTVDIVELIGRKFKRK